MKKVLLAFLVILVLLFTLYFARNIIIKNTVSTGIKVITGLDLVIEKINVGIFKTVLDVTGLRLLNPAGFTDKIMVDIPRVYVDYDLGAILKGKVHIRDLKLNLSEFIVVKNNKGLLNIESLTALSRLQKKGGKPPRIQIDSLDLKIGKVIYKDYFNRPQPEITEYKININEQYKNIDNPLVLVSLITTKALMHTTISSLANFDIGPLKKTAEESLKGAANLVSDAAEKTLEAGKTVGETTVGAVKNTTQKIKELIPFIK